jgi:uncharacterized protein
MASQADVEQERVRNAPPGPQVPGFRVQRGWGDNPGVRVFLLALALAIVTPDAGEAERIGDIPNPRARDGSWVSDGPGRLQADTVARINAVCADLERTTGVELAVVVVRTLDGESIETLAVRLFEAWGIGKRHADNGLLLLWAADDRRVRVEVGYGLEGALPDGKAGAILDRYVIPRFKGGEFDAGILDGVQALASVARSEPLDLPNPASQSYDRGPSVLPGVLAALGLVPLAGGGLFGYRRWRRYRRRRCPECGTWMTRLSEALEDEALDRAAQLEERLGSMDYDVWRCGSCSNRFSLRYPRLWTRFAKCPQCGYRTCASTDETIRAATTTRTGSVRVTERCEFCHYRRNYTRTVPKVSSSSSGGSSGSGGSSFGGGSSGGGGASRSY